MSAGSHCVVAGLSSSSLHDWPGVSGAPVLLEPEGSAPGASAARCLASGCGHNRAGKGEQEAYGHG